MTEPRRLSVWTTAAHLAALSAFAIAKPLFDMLDGGTLIEWNYRPFDVVLVGFGLLIVPPALMLALELVARAIDWRAGYWLHLLLIAGLVYLFGARASEEGPLENEAIWAAVGAAAALAYHRFEGIRSFASVLALAAPLFLVMFLFTSSSAKVVFPAEVEPEPARSRPTPVVMIVFDEFPVSSIMTADERVNAERFPNFGMLARMSTWYRNAITVHDYTRHSVPSIVSGRVAAKKAYALANDHRDSLFTLLGRSHRLDVFESFTRLCPANLCAQRMQGEFPARIWPLLEEVTREYLKDVLPRRVTLGLRDQFVLPEQHPEQDFARLVRSLAERPRKPRFAYLHVQSPHRPFAYLPSGRRYRDPAPYTKETVGPPGPTPANRVLADALLQRHLAQVGFADRMLGRVLAALRRTGELRRALVVVVADHGWSSKPGQLDNQRRTLAPHNAADVVPIPLFVKAPGQRQGRIDDSYARTIDVAPTVASVLRARLPGKVDGRPLGPPRPLPARIPLHPQHSPPTSVPSALILRGRAAQAERVATLFGPGPADPGLLRTGPQPDLVDAVGGIAVPDRPSIRAEIDRRELFDSVDLGGEVPAYVTGTIVGPGAASVRGVAILLNGRVATTAWTYRDGDRVRFQALVGDRLLRQGRNAVRVLPLSPAVMRPPTARPRDRRPSRP